MSVNNVTLTVFKSQADAEVAVRQLERAGFDLGKVLMIGGDAGSDAPRTSIVQSMGAVDGPDKIGATPAGLHELGLPRNSVLRGEAALKAGKVVLIAEGSAMAMILCREVFRRTPVEVIEQHLRLPQSALAAGLPAC